jgi:hypothetical protein
MRRLFFVHVPKTAGTSLRSAIEDAVGRDRCVLVSTREEIRRFVDTVGDPSLRLVVGGHYELHKAVDFIARSPVPWQIFTVFRDPFRRLMSEFTYLTSGEHPEHEALRGMSFREFALDHGRTYRSICRWFSRQATFESAHRSLLDFDVTVFRLSRFEAMLEDLSKALGCDLEHRRLLVSSNVPEPDAEGLRELFAGLREDYMLHLESLKGSYRSSLGRSGRAVRARSRRLRRALSDLQSEVRKAEFHPQAPFDWQRQSELLERRLELDPPWHPATWLLRLRNSLPRRRNGRSEDSPRPCKR